MEARAKAKLGVNSNSPPLKVTLTGRDTSSSRTFRFVFGSRSANVTFCSVKLAGSRDVLLPCRKYSKAPFERSVICICANFNLIEAQFMHAVQVKRDLMRKWAHIVDSSTGRNDLINTRSRAKQCSNVFCALLVSRDSPLLSGAYASSEFIGSRRSEKAKVRLVWLCRFTRPMFWLDPLDNFE